LLAVALSDQQASAEQRAMMTKNPNHLNLADMRGRAPTLGDLSHCWPAVDDPAYAQNLLTRALAIMNESHAA
jgi:hypothetical protein